MEFGRLGTRLLRPGICRRTRWVAPQCLQIIPRLSFTTRHNANHCHIFFFLQVCFKSSLNDYFLLSPSFLLKRLSTMVHIEEVPDTTTAIQDNTSHEFSSSRTIETAQLLPNFVGKVLKSGDGLVSVPFLSRMYNWSYNVAWMSKVDPSTWIFETRLELARRPNRNITTCLNLVIIPVIDFLVHRNRCMIDLNQDSDMPSHLLWFLKSSEASQFFMKLSTTAFHPTWILLYHATTSLIFPFLSSFVVLL